MEILTEQEFNDLLNKLKALDETDRIDNLIELYLNNKITLKEFKILNVELKIDD